MPGYVYSGRYVTIKGVVHPKVKILFNIFNVTWSQFFIVIFAVCHGHFWKNGKLAQTAWYNVKKIAPRGLPRADTAKKKKAKPWNCETAQA